MLPHYAQTEHLQFKPMATQTASTRVDIVLKQSFLPGHNVLSRSKLYFSRVTLQPLNI